MSHVVRVFFVPCWSNNRVVDFFAAPCWRNNSSLNYTTATPNDRAMRFPLLFGRSLQQALRDEEDICSPAGEVVTNIEDASTASSSSATSSVLAAPARPPDEEAEPPPGGATPPGGAIRIPPGDATAAPHKPTHKTPADGHLRRTFASCYRTLDGQPECDASRSQMGVAATYGELPFDGLQELLLALGELDHAAEGRGGNRTATSTSSSGREGEKLDCSPRRGVPPASDENFSSPRGPRGAGAGPAERDVCKSAPDWDSLVSALKDLSLYGDDERVSESDAQRSSLLKSTDVFCDLGSGVGKLVLQVFLTTNVKRAIGVELGATRHEKALAGKDRVLACLRSQLGESAIPAGSSSPQPSAHVRALDAENTLYLWAEDFSQNIFFECGDFVNSGPTTAARIGGATVIFFCSLMCSDDIVAKVGTKLLREAPKLRYFCLLTRFEWMEWDAGGKDGSSRGRLLERVWRLKRTVRLPMSWSEGRCPVFIYAPPERATRADGSAGDEIVGEDAAAAWGELFGEQEEEAGRDAPGTVVVDVVV